MYRAPAGVEEPVLSLPADQVSLAEFPAAGDLRRKEGGERQRPPLPPPVLGLSVRRPTSGSPSPGGGKVQQSVGREQLAVF